MAQRLITDSLVIASHNPGKVSEIRDLLRPFSLTIHSAADLDLPEPEETGATFSENATLKAVAAAEGSGMAALADDSGLVVPARPASRFPFAVRTRRVACKRLNG